MVERVGPQVSFYPPGQNSGIRNMEGSIYEDLGGDRLQDSLASPESDVSPWFLVSPPHVSPLVIVGPSQDLVNRLVDGLNIGLSDRPATDRLHLVLTADGVEHVLQRSVGYHGHQRRKSGWWLSATGCTSPSWRVGSVLALFGRQSVFSNRRQSYPRRIFGSFLATHWRHTAVECRQRVAQGG